MPILFEAEEIETDVLVIGCGMGGARAALRAQEMGARVTLVEKAKVARAGPMTYVHTQYAPSHKIEGDELYSWIEELVVGSNYIVDQEACKLLVDDAYLRMKELIDLGLPFARNDKGELEYIVLRGHRVGTSLAADGRVCMDMLYRIMRQKRERLRIVEKVQILDLLTSDGQWPTGGQVTGAVGVNVQTGAPYVFRAKQVILNTGAIYPKMHYNFADHCTGEGHAMAYRAGARMTGMEFLTYAGWGIFSKAGEPDKTFATGGQAKYQKIGHFINSNGDRFMDRYDPVWGEQTGLVQMARGIMSEVLEGRGPCYLDLRGATSEQIAHLFAAVPSAGRSFKEFGIDPSKDLLQLHPVNVIGSQSSGGVEAALQDAQSTVPGLYAVGYCSHNPHMMSGISVPITTWSNIGGYRAGEAAAQRAQQMSPTQANQAQVKEILRAFYHPTHRIRQVRPADIWSQIQRVTTAAPFALFKTQRRIEETREALRSIEQEMLPQAYAPDVHELVRINEAKSYLQVAQLVCHAMAARTESRGELFRIDYPQMDNDNWLKWVRLQRTGESMAPSISYRDLPVEEWPVPAPPGKFAFNYPIPERFREQQEVSK